MTEREEKRRVGWMDGFRDILPSIGTLPRGLEMHMHLITTESLAHAIIPIHPSHTFL